jgi:hypothetical protein
MQPRKQNELTSEELQRARARFGRKVVEVNGHWLWQASKDAYGFGWFRLAPRYNATNAHRIAWLLWRGDLDGPEWVINPCFEPGCVSPWHATKRSAEAHQAAWNQAGIDAWRGSASPQRKLSEAKARFALRLLRNGWLQRQVAAKLGVSEGLIGLVATGRMWAKATGLPPKPMRH